MEEDRWPPTLVIPDYILDPNTSYFVELVGFLTCAKPSTHYPLYLSLKLLRNLCGGEILNQNSLLEVDGVDVVARAVDTVKSKKNYGIEVFCRAGEEHKNAVWFRFFPGTLKNMAKTRERDFLNVLCMVVHTCCDGSYELMGQLHGVQGVQLVADMVGTSYYANGLVEDWLQELLDTLCLKGSYFLPLFKELRTRFDASIDAAVSSFKKLDDLKVGDIRDAHVYLLYLLYSRLKRKKRSVSNVSKEVIYPPGRCSSTTEDSVVELLLWSWLVDHLLNFPKELGPPSKINKFSCSEQLKICPFAGFNTKILSFIDLCLDGRKHVQDEIRQKGAMLLLLQQCFEDENHPTRRLTGLMTVAKLLDGNKENQDALKELKKTEYLPKFAGVGPGVKIDPETGHAIFIVRLE
ncbi:uncharacterized protein LOC113335884 [Papaver somniferum]|uniref:uncharacterized protein LOC113335884 n=1 Tax=Papaver somniferum TaxID=3469 RepID=UPI000E6FD811|nr:uncharacterized protein LOC113335884 [Papaver somniferum]